MAIKISDRAVEAATGKNWRKWNVALSKAKKERWSHQEIVAHLKTRHKLSSWWCQMVAVVFEKENRLRAPGRTASAGYEVGAQGTFIIPAKQVWNFVTSTEGFRIWLKPVPPFVLSRLREFRTRDGAIGIVRVLRPPHHLRITWQPRRWNRASTVQIRVVPTGKGKTSLRFHQEQIPNAAEREKMRKRWKDVLARFGEIRRRGFGHVTAALPGI